MTTRLLPAEEWDKLDGELAQVRDHLDPSRAAVVVVEDGDQVVGCWALLYALHAEGVWIAPTHRGRASVARRLLLATLEAARQLGSKTIITGALTPEVERLLTQHLGAVPVPGKPFVFATGGV